MNSFKRLENGKIIVDGVIYDSINPEKAATVLSKSTGLKVHSIRIDEKFYYPVGTEKVKN